MRDESGNLRPELPRDIDIASNIIYEGWNFNSSNYLFTIDTKSIHVSKFYCPSM